jgi:Flp pilus assembly protein CpaB
MISVGKNTPLIVGLVVAAIALFGAFRMVRQKEQSLKKQYAEGVKVVATATDVEEGETLRRDHLQEKEIPERFIPATALRGEDAIRSVEGLTVNRKIAAGEMLTWADIRDLEIGGLSARIPASMRAYTLRVNNGVATDLVRPNDHIDIIGTFVLPARRPEGLSAGVEWEGEPRTINSVLLQDVTVLAVGGNMDRTLEGGSGSSLTVALELQESQLLMFARQHGELGVVLRQKDDLHREERADLPTVSFQSFEDRIVTLDERRQSRIIEVQRSGGKSDLMEVQQTD